MTPIALNPGHDVAALRDTYARLGRVQIGNLLHEDGARDLLAGLAASDRWKLTLNRGEEVLDYSRDAYAQLAPADRGAISRLVVDGGRNGFQFCYDTIRMTPDLPADAPLARFAAFLNTPAMLDFCREVTGQADIARGDAHASRFGPGQFLTTHEDHIAGKGRRAAYVMNLTPQWRPDWGGLLLFHDAQGNVARGLTPNFNALNLFAVPQPHAVSWVTPLAPHPRMAITGWLLGDPDGDGGD